MNERIEMQQTTTSDASAGGLLHVVSLAAWTELLEDQRNIFNEIWNSSNKSYSFNLQLQ